MATLFDFLHAPPAMETYAQSLLARVGQAMLAPFRPVALQGWEPVVNDCHINVAHWTLDQGEDYHVLGWLVIDNRAYGRGVRFVMHSVVEEENGTLYDVTPVQGVHRYPFLRSDLDPDTYWEYEALLYAAYDRSQFDVM